MVSPSLKQRIAPDTRFRLGRGLLHLPLVSGPYVRFRPAFREYRFSSDASLVVDGFPRSANTYAWHALKLALGGTAKVCGHTHSPATLIRAVRNGVPALLLLRNPDDAVASYVQQAAGVRPSSAFRAYTQFHAPLRPFLSQIVVADFSEVISDFRSVMQRVNQRFETRFSLYEMTERNEELIRSRIDESIRLRWNGVLHEAGVARPSEHRQPSVEVLIGLDTSALRAQKRAKSIYSEISGSCIEA